MCVCSVYVTRRCVFLRGKITYNVYIHYYHACLLTTYSVGGCRSYINRASVRKSINIYIKHVHTSIWYTYYYTKEARYSTHHASAIYERIISVVLRSRKLLREQNAWLERGWSLLLHTHTYVFIVYQLCSYFLSRRVPKYYTTVKPNRSKKRQKRGGVPVFRCLPIPKPGVPSNVGVGSVCE